MARNVDIELMTLFDDQVRALELPGRFKVIRCGRRWGKTGLGVTVAADDAIKGRYVGWFAPEYKFVAETYREIETILDPIKKNSSKDGVFSTITKGRIDFWSLENPLAGRSRKYHRIIIDEAAFGKDNLLDIWRKNLRPTLLDYAGEALILSNTNGNSADNFLYQICPHDGEKVSAHGFVEYHAPTHANPHLPREELDKLQAENHPLVYQQEYLADFVDWSGVAFFSSDSLLVNGLPVEMPKKCDSVFAVIDSAVKTGSENDGTAVIYYAYTEHLGRGQYPLVILDYDIQQIEGALLETWLPTVFKTLEDFALRCGARNGSTGAFIEDKSSGMVLIQQAKRRNWPAQGIDSKLTSVGKDERAISVSGYVYRKMVKIGQDAFDRVVTYKGTTRNHLISQVTGFRIGDKDAAKRADDLLDGFTYGTALALGDSGGF